MTQVFISYSRNDMEFVQQLAVDLQHAGLNVWWDLSDIQGSEVWERRIEEGLRTSQYFIVVLSPASLESRWVRREYLSADKIGLRIIPLKLKTHDEVPLTLRDIQPIDAVDRKYADVLSEVLRILKYQTPDVVSAMNSKGLEENNYFQTKMPVLSIAPFDLVGMILPIIYFLLTGLDALDLLESNESSFVWGLSAILTCIYLFIKRQISPGLPTKISLIVFLLAVSTVSYSETTGIDLTILPSKVEGLVALICAGLLFANLRSRKRLAPFSAMSFAVFLLLVGAKILINLFGVYPDWIYTFIILSGIITSIVLWLDQ